MKFIPPKKSALTWTNVEDPINYYYYPLIGFFYRKRVQMVLDLMEKKHFPNLIDIGYGCGILFPALSLHAKKLFGLETHDKEKEVETSMKKLGLDVTLMRGNICDLSNLPQKYRAITLISVLEHIKEINTAITELAQIQNKGGYIFIGSPVKNKITDFIFTIFGFDYEKHHPNSHRDILRALKKKYKITQVNHFPPFVPLDYSLYFSAAGRKR